MIRCPRCNREAMGWHLRRPDRCSPQGWVFCLREPEVIRLSLREPSMPLTTMKEKEG